MDQHLSGTPLIRPRRLGRYGARSAASILVAVAATAIAVWGAPDRGMPSMHFTPSLDVPVAAPVAALAPAPALSARRSPTSPSRHPRTAASPVVPHVAPPLVVTPVGASTSYTISYGFDGGAANPSLGAHGEPALLVLTRNGGALRTVKHNGGDGIGFPARCIAPGTPYCPHAILQTSGGASLLNPGTRTISFGATIKVGHNQTSDGANVVQKGFAVGGSEFKLQVDGAAGRPSCAVVGTGSPKIYLVKSSVPIDDRAWHTVSCGLRNGFLSITVDGTVRGEHAVPKTLNISNSDELRIGGKGRGQNNDQFNGELDDVWITIGS